MKQVFLADDEPLVTDAISTLVDWERYGMKICGIAHDGLEAADRILSLRPDLVITDIRMPGQNGLDMIAALQPRLPKTRFAIISGYNDFSYIRAAVRLNVVDYLDKPVTVEKIESMLAHICECEEKGPAKQVPSVLEPFLPLQNLSVMELACTKSFVQSFLPGALQRVFDPLGIAFALFETQDGCIAVCWSDAPYQRSIVTERLARDWMSYFASDEVNAIGLSNPCEQAEELPEAMTEASCARKYAEFFGDEILEIGSVGGEESRQSHLQKKEQISLALRTGDWEKAEETVREILREMETARPDPDVVRHICLEIIYLCASICAESGTEYSEGKEPFLPHIEIGRMVHVREVTDWTIDTVQKMIAWNVHRREQVTRKDVQKAKNYIDAHYDEAITLRMLADMCYMNPNYFSAVFRSSVGMTYVKYLNTVRMEHAKQMLRFGGKIKEISRVCGFLNTRYFSEKFKSYTGVTPEQYRLTALAASPEG